MRELTFISPKCGRMVIPPAIDINCRMNNMEHLVKHHILNDKARCFFCVQRSADNDGILSGVVMTEDTISLSL